MSTTNKQGGGSAWSRPLNNSRGRFGGSGGGGSGRAPPGMEGGRDTNSSSRNNSWRSGRSNPSLTPNNDGNRSKPVPSAASTPPPVEGKEQNERNVLRERFLHLCISMIGQTVTLTQTNGLVLEGIFHTFAPFENQPKDVKNIYVIQACKMVKPPTDTSDSTFENGATVLVPASKVANVHVKSMRLDAANAAEKGVASGAPDDMFQTDSQISGGKGGSDLLVAAGSEWTSAGAGGDALEAGLPSRNNSSSRSGSEALNWRSKKSPASGGAGGGVSGNMDESIGDWDQFAANQEKFGVKTSFDENLYTTKLDRDKIDQAKFKEAERIAREIESQTTTNIHLAEERNQKLALDFDEEDLYSGVLDKSGKDKAAREEEARKKAAAPKMSWAAAAAKKKDGEGAPPPPPAAPAEKPKATAAAPLDMSELKVSSEEKKVDESETREKPEDVDKKVEEENKQGDKKEEKEEKEEDKPKSTKLNANAKEFTFNPGAKSFTPSAPSIPAPTHFPGPMMAGPQFVPGGPPIPGMMPVPMPMHQQYPGAHYGGMPPPQQGGLQLPGQQEGGGEASSATGEGSEAAQQQHQQQPPQYMQQPGFGVPPGGYPGYYPPHGGGAHPMMHPQARPGPGFHPQMGQQMMPGQVPYQRMFAPGMPPGGMRPPGPYYPGAPPYPGGGYPPHGGPDDDYYRRNSGGRGGRNPKKKNSFDRKQSGGRGGRGGYHQANGYDDGRSGDPSPSNEVEANTDITTADGAPAISENQSPKEPQSTVEGGGT
ncbi:hypothetical protein ACHAXM_006198 [Skeletonema potamos]